jgi:tetratricopeptide (TPR) repeat protein
LEVCLALQRQIGNLAGEARALRWAATAAGRQGEFKKDEQLMRASLAIYEQLGNQRGAAQSLANLGVDLGLLGDFRESARLHRESIDRFRHLGIASLAAYQQGALATAEEAQGHYEKAASLAQEALVIARQREVTLVHSLCLRILSTVAIVQKRYAHAQALLEERDCLLLGSSMGTQIGFACHCYVAIGRRDYLAAVRYLRSALQGDDQAAASLLWTLPAGALLLGRLGDIRQALAVYASLCCHPFVGNSRWFDDVVGTPLREQARSLPRRVMLEIEDKERDLNIWATAAVLREQVRGWQASGVAPSIA